MSTHGRLGFMPYFVPYGRSLRRHTRVLIGQNSNKLLKPAFKMLYTKLIGLVIYGIKYRKRFEAYYQEKTTALAASS